MKIRKIVFGLCLLLSVSAMADTQVVAHRGYWRAPGSAQNSISSYENADRIGCYGSEIDLWMTIDGHVVVNHDATFKGVNIQNATFDEVRKIRLDNGEQIPTLEEYLKVAKKGKSRLVIEIKTHKDLWQLNQCVDKTLAAVKKFKMEKDVDYIAFSYAAVLRIIEKAPKGTPVYYLNGDLPPQKLKQIGCAGPDYHENVFLKTHPEWIKECHDLGLKVNVWTVDDENNLKHFINEGVDYITTNEPELLQKLLKK